MNSPQRPIPPVLRWLAVVPAIIMVADYAFLAPATPSKHPAVTVAVVETAPPIGQAIVKNEGQSVRLTPDANLSF